MAAWSFLFSYTMRVSLPKKYCSFVGRLVGWLVGWLVGSVVYSFVRRILTAVGSEL